ncbi:MAG: molecular chaperone DnaK [Verrucomicrobiaceae bacterium]|nr:MAG: molecular chaperone DnaK [Verrucomicrobiaceae bacterium]
MSDIAGIDLGTTQSLIGVVEAGFPILLADESGSRLTPSAVYFGPDGAEPVVGRNALRRRLAEPSRTVVSIKRLIGRRAGESAESDEMPYPVRPGADGRLGVPMDGRQWSPVEISAEILRHLKAVAERALERPVTRAVITVPAYFNDAQRQATRQAGVLAGFTVERILNEPTAAALAFGLDKLASQSKIAVYDLGGGTFDISILELNEGVFQVLATHGDTRLGGDDLDRALAGWLARQAFPETALGQLPLETQVRLHEAAIQAKHALSFAETTEVQLPFLKGTESFVQTVTRPEFEALARPIVDRTRALCRQALADAGLSPSDLSAAVLVGGSTRVPLVRRTAQEIFGREPDTSQHPDETVALGAVIQAGILSGAMRQVVLLDVTPLSLGMETFGGLMNVILPRNTTIPARAGEMFTNAVAGQSSMRIRVLQGEREMARDNWELGQFEVEFEPGPKASARVGVQFEIDADGILKVLARDTKTNTDRILEITHAAVDVEDARVEQMIAESVDHAFEDMTERQRTEATLKAQELLAALDAALPQAGDALDEATRREIDAAAAEVRAALAGPELARLKSANQRLDLATESLAAILVERAMEAALSRRGVL